MKPRFLSWGAVALLLWASPAAAVSGDDDGFGWKANVDLSTRLESLSSYAVDDDATAVTSAPTFNAQLRFGASVTWKISDRKTPVFFLLEAEGGARSGSLWGRTDIDGTFMPTNEERALSIRKANIGLAFGPIVQIRAGFMTSHWGLGLLANDGTAGWTRTNATFNDPRGGDVVLRAAVSTGPWTDASLRVAMFVDSPWEDDLLLPGDRALQYGGAVTLGERTPDTLHGGVYALRRVHRADDGDQLDLAGADLHVHAPIALTEQISLTLEAEGAFIVGKTDLGASPSFPEARVAQLGGVFRTTLGIDRLGGVVDLIYASGDQDGSEGVSHGFRIDPNLTAGLLLYRHVIAGQTARAVATASDPLLVGVPREDLERFPTRGSITNTVAVFPRLRGTPVKGLEVYGGPLLAWSNVPLVDPLQTRFAGGEPRNAFGASPGAYLGTEIDLGVKWDIDIFKTGLSLGAEGAAFIPGGAFALADGTASSPVFGGRALLGYRL